MAQDTNLPLAESTEREEISTEVDLVLSPGETDPHPSQSKTLQSTAISKDSLVQKTPVQKVKGITESNHPEKPSSEADDSILSFNFLYYIIQKFKMSDIVDQ